MYDTEFHEFIPSTSFLLRSRIKIGQGVIFKN